MKAVVLAAGEGTRLRPLTKDMPKGMVKIAEAPLLTHCFDQLIELGVDELVVVVGYRKERIIDHYGDAYESVPITYAHQREQKASAEPKRFSPPPRVSPYVRNKRRSRSRRRDGHG